MIKKSKSVLNLTAKQQHRMDKKREKQVDKKSPHDVKMNSLVKSLENSIYECQKNERVLEKRQLDKNKLQEAKKDNKQLLNLLQQQCSNHNLSVSRSQIDISPTYSTVSMVHLQYKYEELLSSHEGLLKLLEAKVKEVRKCYMDYDKLVAETKLVKTRADEHQQTISMVCNKYINVKVRKERKIQKLRFERDTLKLAHDKLVHLLHGKCMEQDELLFKQLGKTADCLKSLLINEIRRANKLQYENVILNQKNVYLRSKLGSNVNLIDK